MYEPMDMAPAMSSATPPITTNLEFPIEERPAVSAKGTVSPSDSPIILWHRKLSANL